VHTSWMKILSQHVQVSSHTPGAIYQLWSAPHSWPLWDSDVTEVRLADEPVVGAKGWMRPSSGPATTFKITAMRPDRLVTTTSRMPGATLSFEHVIESAPEGSRITVTISVDGPLSAFWSTVLRRNFGDAAPRNIAGLVAYLDAA
jgi:hypothetical protein